MYIGTLYESNFKKRKTADTQTRTDKCDSDIHHSYLFKVFGTITVVV